MTLRGASAAFLEGYRLARCAPPDDVEGLVARVCGLGGERVPFAVEGAAMALEGGDDPPELSDGAIRGVERLSSAAPSSWAPFIALGRGCALARVGAEAPDDPWVLDGYGFHTALFGPAPVRRAGGVGPRYYRGVGRALWFRTDGDARASVALAARVGGGDDGGQVDELWTGLATACTFAGDPRGHAGALCALGAARSVALRVGAEEALRLWRTFAVEAPSRVLDAVEAFRA